MTHLPSKNSVTTKADPHLTVLLWAYFSVFVVNRLISQKIILSSCNETMASSSTFRITFFFFCHSFQLDIVNLGFNFFFLIFIPLTCVRFCILKKTRFLKKATFASIVNYKTGAIVCM